MRTHILPRVEQTGVPPRGHSPFRISTTEPPPRRGSSPLPRKIGFGSWKRPTPWASPARTTRVWLDNLAKTHGVRVGSAWGLDWQIPLLRPDAISPELTARFSRIAGQLGHEAARRFSEESVNAQQSNGGFQQRSRLKPQRGHSFADSRRPSTSRLVHAGWPSTVRAAMLPSLNTAYTRSPSVTGVGVAYEFCGCLLVFSWRKTSTCQSCLPSARAKARTRHDSPPSAAVVMKTRSPQTIGDACPSPGTSAFHATFFVALHWVGRLVSLEIPCPVGPRNCGQFSARAAVAVRRSRVVDRKRFIAGSPSAAGVISVLAD